MMRSAGRQFRRVDEMNATTFGDYATYYDALYRDKDYAAEAEYVAQSIRRACPAARSILEFGSGTGKHARLLQQRGFEVVGIERSASMAAHAGSAFRCIHGDIRSIRVERRFDAVVSLFHVISYLTT